jgi:hypothetical protein
MEKEKWADYLISAVRYEPASSKKIISYVKVHIDNGEDIGESKTWSKIELLEALNHGKTFITILKNGNGKWLKGEQITVSSFKEVFVRSDFRNLPGDYLDRVTEF